MVDTPKPKKLTIKQESQLKLGISQLKSHNVDKHKWSRWNDNTPGRERDKYIYLIRCNGFYKVGTSNSPASRLNGMITSSPYPLELTFAAKVKDAVYMEHLIHNVLWKAKWIRGEWYLPDMKDFKRLAKFIDYIQELSYGNKETA